MVKRISGERSLKIGAKNYTLRLSFKALEDIEVKYGSILDLFNPSDGENIKLSVIYYTFSKMVGISPEDGMVICNLGMLGEISETIGDVLAATLNPEKQTGGKKPGNAKARKG